MMQFDVNVNLTLEMADTDWKSLVDSYVDDEALDQDQARLEAEEEALYELQNDLEGVEVDTYYGRAWVAWADEVRPLYTLLNQ